MSNLVMSSDKRERGPREKDITGEPESLAGRIDLREMGSRLPQVKAPIEKPTKQYVTEDQMSRKRKRDRPAEFSNILDSTEYEGLTYRPKSNEGRENFANILTLTAQVIGDVASDILRSAADAALEIMKDDSIVKDLDKKKEIESLWGTNMNSTQFSQLLQFAKRITDYEDDKDAEDRRREDEQYGVSMQVDDDDDQEDKIEDDVSEDDEEDLNVDIAGEGADLADLPEEFQATVVGEREPKRAKLDDSKVYAHEIDAFWLQRTIAAHFSDAVEAQEKSAAAMAVLASDDNSATVENKLMEIFDFEHFPTVTKLVINRDAIVWCTRLARAEDDKAKATVAKQIEAAGLGWILTELYGRREKVEDVVMQVDGSTTVRPMQPMHLIDLDNLVFAQGNHLMANKRVTLPQGSEKVLKKGYEEIHIPAPKASVPPPGEKKVSVNQLPEWARAAFTSAGINELNRIQSKLFPVAFGQDDNILLCAPTGAGKTNVAMLCILNELMKYRKADGSFAKDQFKMIYIAPLKALVAEMVGAFSKRLEPYGIRVEELTGDRQMTKQQISETQIIVCTPEKWDVITRKQTDTSYTNLVRLIIIDEIHLLHDERGPVLESIVARTVRWSEQTGENVRLVGLSATLPNYRDVATFLRVDEKGLFFFDASYRPCPLRQEFVGITEKKAIKRLKAMDDVAYDKVMEQAGKNQMLIFVHSRKETARTAKYIRDKAIEEETIGQILRPDAAAQEILRSEADSSSDGNLKDLLPYGFAIHHAGMSRADRTTVEDLFAGKYIQVLVCTATLAWGVNLPAHCVIIKGTQIYAPEKGTWVELSPQDLIQMIGRAGRPQYDTYGEAIIITQHSELQYYLSLLNQQLPIESQFMSKLADNLNAEIVLGTVRTRDEAVKWLAYTYLYVRMLRSPALYRVGGEYEDDEALVQKRVDLVHSAATVLAKCRLIKYDPVEGTLSPTEWGRIASHYYLTHNSMSTYGELLNETVTDIDLFRIFSLSQEFKYVPVRSEEKIELNRIKHTVPIAIKETTDEPSAKINILLQSYISRIRLEGFAINADMVYITQSAGRILRALFEMCLKHGWSAVAKMALNMCKMVERRMWLTNTPFRQFPRSICPLSAIQKFERTDLPFSRIYDLDIPALSETFDVQTARLAHRLAREFPRVELQAHVQPITRLLLRVELTITPNFNWNDVVHGQAQLFWIMVEDVDGERLLFHDQFILRKKYIGMAGSADKLTNSGDDHIVDFTVPMFEPMMPQIYISVLSDRWLHSETKLAVSFRHLLLPELLPPHTKLLDRQPLPVTALQIPEFIQLYPFSHMNKIQTQVFHTAFNTDDNFLVGAPTGSGKTMLAEIALMRHWTKEEPGRVVYIAPMQEMVDERLADWQRKFSNIGGGKEIVALTGEISADLKLLERGDVVFATPTQWDLISRRWKQRKNVQTVELFIADEIHLIGGTSGPIYEVIISRMRFIAAQLERKIRIIALSVSLANALDLGEWIGCTKNTIFNFSPKSRPNPLEVRFQEFNIPHFPSLMLAMAKPTYLAITKLSYDRPVIVFVPNRRQCRLTADELIAYAGDQFRRVSEEELAPHISRAEDSALAETLIHGIGYYHEAMSAGDKRLVERLYNAGAIQVVLVSRDVCWSVPMTAHLVIIMGTQYFDGSQHRYRDYLLAEVLQMLGRACRPSEDERSRAVLMTPATKKNYYLKFINEALPIESFLQLWLHDAFVTEVSTKTIENKQDAVDWLTWTYFYRRLVQNPSFYGLQDTSHQALSDFLSDLVETTLAELADAKILAIEDEMDIIPMNSAMIAAYYNISWTSLHTFSLSLTSRTKLKGLLEIITSAAEYEELPIRKNEDVVLRRVYDRVPVKLSDTNYESPHFKAFVLLQAHFSRLTLPPDLVMDQVFVLNKVLNLLSACVDVMSSEGWLNAFGGMELSQMVVQAMWDRDSPLKQVPHFNNEIIDRCKEAGIETVFDLMEMEDDQRTELLQMTPNQLAAVAGFVNKYPNIDINFELEDPESIVAKGTAFLKVQLERDVDEDEEVDAMVHAPFYPGKKLENWWLVIASGRELVSIKRITFSRQLSVRLNFTVPAAGRQVLKLFCFSDSYVGVDQEHEFEVVAGEAEEEDEDDEMEDE